MHLRHVWHRILYKFYELRFIRKSDADVACTALFDSASGFKQVVTMRDVINNYPFPNTFKVLAVSGAKLKEAIERSAEYFDVKMMKLV